MELSSGEKTALLVGGIVAAFAVGYFAVSALSKERGGPQLMRPVRRGEKGWFAVGYNYPTGHVDRRVKMVAGPYYAKGDANYAAKQLRRDGFYTAVTQTEPR